MDTQVKEKGILQVAYVLICKAIYRLAKNNSVYLQMEELSDKNKTFWILKCYIKAYKPKL